MSLEDEAMVMDQLMVQCQDCVYATLELRSIAYRIQNCMRSEKNSLRCSITRETLKYYPTPPCNLTHPFFDSKTYLDVPYTHTCPIWDLVRQVTNLEEQYNRNESKGDQLSYCHAHNPLPSCFTPGRGVPGFP
jgi:hypothetical protein